MGDTEPIMDTGEGGESKDDINQDLDTSDKDVVQIRTPKCPVILEPLVILIASTWYPIGLCSSLYAYDRIQSDLATKTGFNLSALNDISTGGCDTNTSSPAYIFTQKVQSNTAYFNIWCSLASFIPALFSTILLSPYSDKAGRKYVIVPSLVSGLLYAAVIFIMIIFELSERYIVLANFVEGLGGGITLLFVGLFAFIADTVPVESRRFRITVLELLMFGMTALGPIPFGYWIQQSGYIWPSIFSVVFRLLSVLYAIFIVPETVIQTERPSFFTISHIKEGVTVFAKKTDCGRRWQLCMLLGAFTLTFLASQGSSIDTLFELNEPFCWDSVTMGYYSTVYMAVASVGGILMAKLLGLCTTDQIIALIAGLASTAHYLIKGFVRTTPQLFLTSVFGLFSILFIPSVRTLVSNLVSSYEQGAVFGAIALVEVICGFAGGFLMNAVYASTLWISSGFVYFVSSFMFALSTSVLLIYILRLRRVDNGSSDEERDDLIINDG